MAEEVQISGSSQMAKIRNPLAPALLPFVTFGIYTLVWYYKINKEMAEMGKARNTEELGTSPTTSLMAVLFGWIIIVPPFLSFYNTWKRKCAAENLTGQDGMEAGLGFLLSILISGAGRSLPRAARPQRRGPGPGLGLVAAAPPPAPPVEQPAPPAEPAAPPEPPAQG